MKPADIDTVIGIFRQRDDFLLTTHVNPDGDGLGSELALGAGLRRAGKRVRIVNYSPIGSAAWKDRSWPAGPCGWSWTIT